MKYRIRRLFVSLPAATFAALLLFVASSQAVEPVAVERVGGDIRYLASDELEGRGPGTKGLEKAAHHIRDEFKKYGLTSGTEDGSYMQPFKIAIDTKPILEKTYLVLRGPNETELKLALGKDFQPLATGGAGKAKAEVVFAGYGISAPQMKYDDFKDADVAGKIVLILRHEPQQDNKESVFNGEKITTHSHIRTKLQAAKKNKAAAVLLVNSPFMTKSKDDPLTPPNGFGTGSLGVPFAHITQATANKLLKTTPVKSGDAALETLEAIETKIDDTLQPMTQSLAGWTAEFETSFEKIEAEVANVVGVLEGEGPNANETIVIGAHYDHLGFGPFGSRRPKERAVHNGADDNATGTAAVMELARRFAERDKKPARRLVFIGFSAEERGLVGSNYYVANPLFPLEETVAMFNFDMIGRLSDKGLLMGGITSAVEFKELTEAAEEANGDEKLKLKTSGQTGGSDHVGFFNKGVPVLFFFTGLTKEYHTPDDDFETINVEGVVQTIDFAESVMSKVVDLPARPTFVKPSNRRGIPYLGIVPDYSSKTKGLKVTSVNADSPAAKGGLKPNDVIVQLGETPVANVSSLTGALRKQKPGDKVKVTVQRGEEKVTLEVTLATPPKQG